MLQAGVNRESTVHVKGGGMLLDLCGFVCSIYMRGVKKVIFEPTTLLAIVDATVGGKNGINFEGGKNMLGVVNHPDEIHINLKFLESLDDRNFSNGLAEVIKMAITHDTELFSLLEHPSTSLHSLRSNKKQLKEIIKRSL